MDSNTEINLPSSLFKTVKLVHVKLASVFAENDICLSPQQFFILKMISEKKSLIQQDLAQMMNADKSSVLRQTNALQKEMLIARIPDEKDKRKKHLVLTQKGGELHIRAEKIGQEFLKTLNKGISETDIKIFYSVLNQLKENAK